MLAFNSTDQRPVLFALLGRDSSRTARCARCDSRGTNCTISLSRDPALVSHPLLYFHSQIETSLSQECVCGVGVYTKEPRLTKFSLPVSLSPSLSLIHTYTHSHTGSCVWGLLCVHSMVKPGRERLAMWLAVPTQYRLAVGCRATFSGCQAACVAQTTADNRLCFSLTLRPACTFSK